MKSFKVKIRGDAWTIYLLDDHEYEHHLDNKSAACTIPAEKRMAFNAQYLRRDIVLHEVGHAYMSYCYLESTHKVSKEDMEEIFCSMLSDSYALIGNTTKELYSRLRSLNK